MEGTEKLKDHLIGLVCTVPFEEWIAARPQDTLTWKMRELTPNAGSGQPSSSTAVCFSLENEKESHWSIAGLQDSQIHLQFRLLQQLRKGVFCLTVARVTVTYNCPHFRFGALVG